MAPEIPTDCCICDKRLSFSKKDRFRSASAFPRSNTFRFGPIKKIHEKDAPEIASILPCGHIFGHKCITKWLNTGQASCPNCRYRLQYSECRHKFEPKFVLQNAGGRDDTKPGGSLPFSVDLSSGLTAIDDLVLPEKLPLDCPPCTWEYKEKVIRRAFRMDSEFLKLGVGDLGMISVKHGVEKALLLEDSYGTAKSKAARLREGKAEHLKERCFF